MDAIDTQAEKLTKMHEYIAKCRAELSAAEDAELAKRNRQYWSASTNKQNYLEKIKSLEEITQRESKARVKNNNVIFIVALLAGLAVQYLNLIDKDYQIILGVGIAAFIVINEFSYQLEANNNATKCEIWKEQVTFYTYQISCSGGGYIEYEEEYLKAKNSDQLEFKKDLRSLYLASIEIAILNGLKSKSQPINF